MILLEDVNRLRREAALGLVESYEIAVPKAENMFKVSWDCVLENLAQATVEKCPHEKTSHPLYGQTFVYYDAFIDNARKRHVVHDAIMNFYGSTSPAGNTEMKFSNNMELLNFLNLIRANTTKMGCSQQLCQTFDGYLTATGVCFFNSPDLGRGDLIYKEGEPCRVDSDCTTHGSLSVCDRYLCAKNRFAAEVVRMHNLCRSQLAFGKVIRKPGVTLPQGANILQLMYDFDLEKEAQKAVKKCSSEPSGLVISATSAETIWANRAEVSLVDVGSKLEAVQMAIISWWEQITKRNKLGPHLIFRNYQLNRPIAEFTQMAWATTGKVACAVERCSEESYDIVCMYKQRGNHPDQQVYIQGSPCSLCPFGTNCDSDTGLCVQYI